LRSGADPGSSGGGASTLCIYLEDEFGQPVLSEIKDELLADVRGFWADQLRKGKEDELVPLTKLGFAMREEFRLTFEEKFPWLRLCAGHWKVFQLWINHFGSWRKHNMKPKVEVGPIIIIDSDDASVGQKRGSTDEGDAEAPKRHKGDQVVASKQDKGKQVATSGFRPPRPKSKPTKVTAKVSNLSFLVLIIRSRKP
jgi:hypothetical protein